MHADMLLRPPFLAELRVPGHDLVDRVFAFPRIGGVAVAPLRGQVHHQYAFLLVNDGRIVARVEDQDGVLRRVAEVDHVLRGLAAGLLVGGKNRRDVRVRFEEDFRQTDRVAEAVARAASEESSVADDRLELVLRGRNNVQMRVQDDLRRAGFAVRGIQDVPSGELLDAAEDAVRLEVVAHDRGRGVDARRIGRDGTGADELFQQGDRIVHGGTPSLFA